MFVMEWCTAPVGTAYNEASKPRDRHSVGRWCVAEETLGLSGAEERVPASLPRGASGAILRALALGPKNVSDLVVATGLSQPNVSNHLARLRERGLVGAHREGRQMIYRIASAGLAHFVLTQGRELPAMGESDADQVCEEFLSAVLTLREEEALRVVDAALATGVQWKDLYLKVFTPALVRVGQLWERGELSVATEHLITGIVHRLLHRLSLQLPVAPQPNAPSVLVGCVEGELHTVGGRMVADFLLAHGWRVWYLNGFLPLEHLMEAVNRHLPNVVALCVTTVEGEEHLRLTVDRLLRWRGEQPLPLIVAGGRYFETGSPIVGLDVWGTDVEQVTAEMDRRVRAILRPHSGSAQR